MLKKLWNLITTLLVVVVLLLAASLVYFRIFEAGAYTVLSGSMEPTYPVGSLIYVKKLPYSELKVGDPVTFAAAQDVAVTHRIVAIEPDEADPALLWFTTRGDANDYDDMAPLDCRNVIGKPVFAIPGLGYAIDYVQQPPGTYLVIAGVGLLLLLSLLPALFAPAKKREQDESQ